MPYRDPKKKTENQRKRRERQRGTADSHPRGEVREVPLLPLKNAADALAALEEQLNACRADGASNRQQIARTVAYIIAVALKAIDVGDIAERLSAVEAMIRSQTS